MPDGWRVARLGEVLRLEYGTSLPERKRVPGKVPVIGSAGVVGFHNQSTVEGPGIVVGRKGSIGTVTWIAEDFAPIDTTYCAVPANELIDVRWVYHLLAREDLAMLNRATGVPGLNRDDVYALSRLIPPFTEQRAIAAVLDAIDAAIERTEAVISATERQRDALLHELLTRGVPGWHTQWRSVPGLGIIPADWQVVRLKAICERITKGTTPTTLGHEYVPAGVRFLRVENIADGLVTGGELRFITGETHQMLSRSILQAGDILLSIAGALGRSALITSEHLPANVNQALAIVRLAKNQRATPEFAALMLSGKMVQKQVDDLRSELAQANINLEQVGSLTVALPSLCEQRAIAEIIAGARGAIEMTFQERFSVQSLKASMTDTLLTGSLRVPIATEGER